MGQDKQGGSFLVPARVIEAPNAEPRLLEQPLVPVQAAPSSEPCEVEPSAPLDSNSRVTTIEPCVVKVPAVVAKVEPCHVRLPTAVARVEPPEAKPPPVPTHDSTKTGAGHNVVLQQLKKELKEFNSSPFLGGTVPQVLAALGAKVPTPLAPGPAPALAKLQAMLAKAAPLKAASHPQLKGLPWPPNSLATKCSMPPGTQEKHTPTNQPLALRIAPPKRPTVIKSMPSVPAPPVAEPSAAASSALDSTNDKKSSTNLLQSNASSNSTHVDVLRQKAEQVVEAQIVISRLSARKVALATQLEAVRQAAREKAAEGKRMREQLQLLIAEEKNHCEQLRAKVRLQVDD